MTFHGSRLRWIQKICGQYCLLCITHHFYCLLCLHPRLVQCLLTPGSSSNDLHRLAFLRPLTHFAQPAPMTCRLTPHACGKHNNWITNTTIILFLKSDSHLALSKQICKTNKNRTTLKTKSTIDYSLLVLVKHSTNCMGLTFDFDIDTKISMYGNMNISVSSYVTRSTTTNPYFGVSIVSLV